MGAQAKQAACCAQCGSPAENGFARQYCSNRACVQYMPPLTTWCVAPLVGYCRAVRRGGVPNSSHDVWMDITWPDGVQQTARVYDQEHLYAHSYSPGTTSTHGTTQPWHGRVVLDCPHWNDTNPMYRAMRTALVDGVGMERVP